MVINVELLDGAIVEHDNEFYQLRVEEQRLVITELFTSARCSDSTKEKEVMRTVFASISSQPE
ncbi:hypothetical protein F2P58_23385 [Vibrio fortis]|uniref:Uncharacterized protein n=1 Tax=Vibrio fortis TaxID=212667 RepID=A0A5N3QU74_9VIBR|nr:hypothetical protein [Vibrio fortis]KAB0285460.1 hypothetical protein F2P58_23385 [Vibrio fortis]